MFKLKIILKIMSKPLIKFFQDNDLDTDLDNYIFIGSTTKCEGNENIEFGKKITEYITKNNIKKWIKRDSDYLVKTENYQHTERCFCNVIIKQNCFIYHHTDPLTIYVIGNICRNRFIKNIEKFKCIECNNPRRITEHNDGLCGKCRSEKERKIQQTFAYLRRFQKVFYKEKYKILKEYFNHRLHQNDYEMFVREYLDENIVYLNVPYDKKDIVKNKGASYNPNLKKWFYVKHIQREILF